MNQKNFENFKKSLGKMSICVNVRMSKIMHMPMKVVKYVNCRTLAFLVSFCVLPLHSIVIGTF